MAGGLARRERIWDPALRVFHWSLAVLVVANWLLGRIGPSDMTLHFWLGYGIGALLLFRLVWGFVGPASARFARFVRGPRAVLAYAREMARPNPTCWPGHSPVGALAVVAMLAVLIAQVTTGCSPIPTTTSMSGRWPRRSVRPLHARPCAGITGARI